MDRQSLQQCLSGGATAHAIGSADPNACERRNLNARFQQRGRLAWSWRSPAVFDRNHVGQRRIRLQRRSDPGFRICGALILIKAALEAGSMLHAVTPMEATMLSIGKVLLALTFVISAPIIAVAQTSEPGNSPPSAQSRPAISCLKPERRGRD